jgi:hypothetical protein
MKKLLLILTVALVAVGCTSGHAISGAEQFTAALAHRSSRILYWRTRCDPSVIPFNFLNVKTVKFLVIGMLFGVVMLKARPHPGSASLKCSILNPFTCTGS